MKHTVCVPIRQLSLVVCVLDAFTGQIIHSKDLRVSIANEPDAIHKNDGYFAFINLSAKAVTLYIQEPHYIAEIIPLCLSELPIEEPLLYIHLTPGEKYCFPSNTAYLSGTAPLGSLIRLVFPQNPSDSIFLQEDYVKKSPQMALHTPSPSLVCGHTFCIKHLDSIHDFFTITKLISFPKGLYELAAPLLNTYSCQTAHIFPVSIAKTDACGYYFLPLRLPKSASEGLCQVFCDTTAESFSINLQSGERKELSFLPKEATS